MMTTVKPCEFLIGGYAPKGENSLLGVRLTTEGDARLSVLWQNAEAENPSFLLTHPNGQVLYTVEERVPDGGIAAFTKDADGWRVAKRLPAGGSAPCHLAMDDRARFLFVSNYMSGSVAVFSLAEDGMPMKMSCLKRHSGHGVNPFRQEGAHVHSSLYTDGRLYAADLGLDTVFAYRLNAETGELTEEKRIRFPDGCGPRHMAIHPDHRGLLYVNAEMGGQVFVVERETGRILQTLSAAPADFQGDLRSAAVKVRGDRLCVSTRDCDAIALFAIGENGLLTPPVIYDHKQKIPRDVWWGDPWLITADEGSFGLTLLRADEGGAIRQIGFTLTDGLKPTCVIPAP